MEQDAPGECRLLERARDGDRTALGELLARHHPQLLRMVRLRLDPRLAGRIGASDVLQEVEITAVRRFHRFGRQPDLPFRVWLRLLARQHLCVVARRHFGAAARDARREVPVAGGTSVGVTSRAVIDQLVAQGTSPSMALDRRHRQQRVLELLDRLGPLDREVLTLRHFEQLTNAEVAAELGLSESGACRRYTRALERFKSCFELMTGKSSSADGARH